MSFGSSTRSRPGRSRGHLWGRREAISRWTRGDGAGPRDGGVRRAAHPRGVAPIDAGGAQSPDHPNPEFPCRCGRAAADPSPDRTRAPIRARRPPRRRGCPWRPTEPTVRPSPGPSGGPMAGRDGPSPGKGGGAGIPGRPSCRPCRRSLVEGRRRRPSAGEGAADPLSATLRRHRQRGVRRRSGRRPWSHAATTCSGQNDAVPTHSGRASTTECGIGSLDP
jgi:hypothetical protein